MKIKNLLPHFLISIFTFLFLFGCSGSKNISDPKTEANLPGKYKGFTLLPNGWRLSPAGNQVGIDELPLNMVLTSDGRYAITSNSGLADNSLSVVDLKEEKEVQRFIIDKTWYGLAFNDDNSKLYVSGGNNNCIYIFNFNSGKLALQDSIVLGERVPKEHISVTGIAFVKSKNYILAVSKESNSLYICNASTNKVIKIIKMDGACYDVKVNHAGTFAYVSVWGNASVDEIDLSNFEVTSKIKVGDHPCQLIITKDDSRLFVANANNNSVSEVNLNKKKETERIISALSPDVPYGSTPNAICFNSDENILMVANADNNYLALFDIRKPGKSKSIGFIPVGWYPTAVQYLKGTNQILVANGKGLTSLPNPDGSHPLIKHYHATQYIGSLFKGTVSIINYPDAEQLSKYSKQVYDNTPYIYKQKNWTGIQNVIPDKHDGIRSEKIKHVFYIIKENRTYDEVFGDLPQGNGDSSLCFFPQNITPNEHKLVSDFTLYDNFYCDAEVSADGHNWSTAAYASDYVEKDWPTNYGGRGQEYNFEGGYPLAAPASGYIWNDVLNHDRTMRDYGEFTEEVNNNPHLNEARDEDLKPYICPTFAGWDLKFSDVDRYKEWKAEFEKYVAGDSLPDFCIMRLPNDHTYGTRKGKETPQAYVAQNDYALGLVVQEISHSKYWKNSIIFVLEDDAQDGSDHVDAHRSTLLVIGPYVKRHYVDHEMYSTSSVLKTIELILGLPPMTQYDLSATPILFSISNKPDLEPYTVVEPKIDLNQKNLASAYGSKECDHLDFTKEDAVPEDLFNEILWKAIKGKNSVMPPPVRSAFVKVTEKKDKDDD